MGVAVGVRRIRSPLPASPLDRGEEKKVGPPPCPGGGAQTPHPAKLPSFPHHPPSFPRKRESVSTISGLTPLLPRTPSLKLLPPARGGRPPIFSSPLPGGRAGGGSPPPTMSRNRGATLRRRRRGDTRAPPVGAASAGRPESRRRSVLVNFFAPPPPRVLGCAAVAAADSRCARILHLRHRIRRCNLSFATLRG